MQAQEFDDYQSDIRFGEWLRSQRVRIGLTLELAAQDIGIPIHRLKTLEMGLSERGITYSESNLISHSYAIPLKDFLHQAGR